MGGCAQRTAEELLRSASVLEAAALLLFFFFSAYSECVSCLCSPFPKECCGYRCVFPHQGFREGSGVEVRSPGLFEECFHMLKCLLSHAANFEIGDLIPQDISGALVHT